MASTRAIARALRSFTNIGMTCLEELADYNDAIGNVPAKPMAKTRKILLKKPPEKEEKKEPPKTQPEEKPKAQSGGNGKPKKKDPVTPKAKEQPAAKEESKTEVKEKSGKKEETKEPANNTVVPKMSEAQKRAVYNLSRRRGITVDDLEKMAQEKYKTSLEELSSKDASDFIRTLQQAA
jgi:hypothetical protein